MKNSRRVLKRLSLEWSRDNDQKVYVKDRKRHGRPRAGSWIADAHTYPSAACPAHGEGRRGALIDIRGRPPAPARQRGGGLLTAQTGTDAIRVRYDLMTRRSRSARHANRLPLLRRRLRRSGAAGWHWRRRPTAIPISRRIRALLLKGFAMRKARPNGPPTPPDCLRRATAARAGRWGTPPRSTSPNGFRRVVGARRGRTRRLLSYGQTADRGLLRRQQLMKGFRVGNVGPQFAAGNGPHRGRSTRRRLRLRTWFPAATRTRRGDLSYGRPNTAGVIRCVPAHDQEPARTRSRDRGDRPAPTARAMRPDWFFRLRRAPTPPVFRPARAFSRRSGALDEPIRAHTTGFADASRARRADRRRNAARNRG